MVLNQTPELSDETFDWTVAGSDTIKCFTLRHQEKVPMTQQDYDTVMHFKQIRIPLNRMGSKLVLGDYGRFRRKERYKLCV